MIQNTFFLKQIFQGGMGTLLGTNISPQKGTFEDDFLFRKVGYVSSPEGMFQMHMARVEYLQYKVYVKMEWT